MGSINGLKNIAATSIQNSGSFLLGNQVDPGTAGQALISGGPNQPAEWGSTSGTIQPLTAGNHVTFSSGNTTFDGSIPDTINTTAGGGLSGGDGIDIVGATIETNNDEITISNSTSLNRVVRLPHTLTVSQNGTTIDTFDGSVNKTIDLQGNFSAGSGIDITGSTISTKPSLPLSNAAGNIVLNYGSGQYGLVVSAGQLVFNPDTTTIGIDGSSPHQVKVLKVPNSLTAGTNITFSSGTTYDGSSAITINASNTNTTYQGGTGISIDTATDPDTINCASIPNTALQNSTISGISLGNNLSTITFYDSTGGFLTSYNGANPPTSVTLPAGGTTYTAGTNLNLAGTAFNVNASLTSIDSITMTSGPGSTAITGNDYSGNPTPMTYFDLSSSTNIFPNIGGVGVGGLGGVYKDVANGFLYRFLLPSDFLNDNDSSGYARSVIADTGQNGAQQCFAGTQYYAFFTIPDGYYFSGFRVNLVNSVGTPQGTTPLSNFYVNVYTKTINSNLATVGGTKGFNTDNLGYTITSGYSASWDINDPITIGAIHCFRNSWNSSLYNRGGWIQYTEGSPGSGK